MSETQSDQPDLEILRIISSARDVWISRLIDPSRSNSLLFYRDLKIGTLDLSAHTEGLCRLLSGEVLTVESLATDNQHAPNIIGGDELTADSRTKKRKALVAIQRKALANAEEKGIDTLYLAVGMSTWSASDGGRPYAAPVLLFPAKIEERGRSGNELRISLDGDPRINPVLIHLLDESFEIHIDPSSILNECGGEDESGHWRVDQERVFAIIERNTIAVPDFKVKPRAILANFQFAKMAMVEDLKKNGNSISSSAIVAAIAGHKTSREGLAEAVCDLEPTQLDDRPASDDFLVLDADSTQHRAVVMALKGQNCVIQGPPGTGKSQTIANLIAQSVAEGRRVLFVAEKRAALDAVIKRLNHPDVGLGHLVLDLHGASISRKDVMARLGHALEQIRQALPTDGVDAVHPQFDARRKQLNEHARRINVKRQPTGLSVHRMIGRLLRIPPAAKSSLRVRGDTLAQLSPERIADVKDWIVEGAANPTLLLGTASTPWNNATITDGVHAQEAIDLAVRASSEYWPKLENLLGQLVQRMRIRPPETLEQTATLLLLLADVRSVLDKYEPPIFSASPAELAEALKPGIGSSLAQGWAFLTDTRYRYARKRLLSCRTAPAPVSELQAEALRADDVLRRWRSVAGSHESPVIYDGESELKAAFSTLWDATNTLAAVIDSIPFGSMSMTAMASHLRMLASDQRTPYQLPRVHSFACRCEMRA
jgi:hypothetical protein